MKNFIQLGKNLTVAAPTGGVASGDPVLIGAIFGVAAFTAAEGAEVELATTGVFSLPKTTGQVWAVGDSLYWDAAQKKLTTTTSDNLRVAVATKAAGSSDTTGYAKIGAASVALTGLIAPQTAVADLSDITGGDAPTEAEHNAVIAKVNAVLVALRGANIIAD